MVSHAQDARLEQMTEPPIDRQAIQVLSIDYLATKVQATSPAPIVVVQDDRTCPSFIRTGNVEAVFEMVLERFPALDMPTEWIDYDEEDPRATQIETVVNGVIGLLTGRYIVQADQAVRNDQGLTGFAEPASRRYVLIPDETFFAQVLSRVENNLRSYAAQAIAREMD